MQFSEFIDHVRERTRLETPEEAERVARAVLETLGERLDRKVRNGVEAQLPNELKEALLARAQTADEYTLEEFYNRVGARADLTHENAAERTRQVLSVLQGAIAEGEKRQILESLPPEYGQLFSA